MKGATRLCEATVLLDNNGARVARVATKVRTSTTGTAAAARFIHDLYSRRAGSGLINDLQIGWLLSINTQLNSARYGSSAIQGPGAREP